MRWPLYLTVNFVLIALVGAGLFGVVQRNARAQAAEQTALTGALDGMIASWNAAGTPPENRVLNVFVGGEPEDSYLDPPEPRSFWTAASSWLHRAASKARHDRETDALLGRDRPTADWYAQGVVWDSERRRRLQALSAYIAKARQAKAHIIVLADGGEAKTALAALQTAAASSTDLVLADKFIVVGADADAYQSLANRDAAKASVPAGIREVLLVWHAEGSGATFAGNKMAFRDAYGRVVAKDLTGEAAKASGAASLIRRLTEPGVDIASQLARAGQLAALAPPGLDPDAERQRVAEESARLDAAAKKEADDAALAQREKTALAQAAPALEDATPPGYVRLNLWMTSVEIPTEWTKASGNDVFIGRRWPGYRQVGIGDPLPLQGWANIIVRFVDIGVPWKNDDRDICPGITVNSVQDLRDEMDCSVPQSCAPCRGRKCPRSPIDDRVCGRFVGVVPAAGAQGYRYEDVFNPESTDGLSDDIRLNRGMRVMSIFVQPPNSRQVYQLEYFAPKKDFDRYLPVFDHLAKSLRPAQ